jgi:hypothetical protein
MDLLGNPLQDGVVDVSVLQLPPSGSFYHLSDPLVGEIYKCTSYPICVDARFHHTTAGKYLLVVTRIAG